MPFLLTSVPPEQGKMSAGGVIAHLIAKCGGNVHERDVVKIAASSVWDGTPRNAADLEIESIFFSDDKPGQWISCDFKALRIKPKHDTV
jgi:hypothetical protein